MKRLLITGATTLALFLGVPAVAPGTVDTASAATSYKTCSQMHRKYPGGVAKSKSAKNMKVSKGKRVKAKSKYKPKVSASLYAKYRKLDRDKDGIACER